DRIDASLYELMSAYVTQRRREEARRYSPGQRVEAFPLEAARDWLRSYAPRADLDEAIARHASSDELARHAPAEAMDLVARIADPARRWQAWQALARSLHDIGPERVALLAQAPGLTPADRARLRDEVQ
ncbi:MAG: hypothetical protein ACK44A_08465, partial [Roseateles sp.]